jgi:hypothetical protein
LPAGSPSATKRMIIPTTRWPERVPWWEVCRVTNQQARSCHNV